MIELYQFRRGLAWTEYKNIVEMVICICSHHARLTTTGQTEGKCHFFSIKIIIALKFSFVVFVYTRKYRF